MNLLVAVVVVWAIVDRWPFRWLAWLWLIFVSAPFLVMVLAVWSCVAGCHWFGAIFRRPRGQAVQVESMAEES